MPLLLNPAIHEAVARDGLPRVADYADDAQQVTQQVLYLDRSIVRSTGTVDWIAQHGALPTDPTPQQVADAIAAREAAALQAEQDAQALRARIVSAAQSAVGVPFDQLTGIQVRSLFALTVLRERGAFDRDGKVRPLSEWLR